MTPPTYVEGFHDVGMMKKMTYNQFGKTDMIVSKLSLGGAPFGDVYGKLVEEEAIQCIKTALRSGVNYIDTAPWYGEGRSEEVIGKALKQIPRKAYYIATKVGRYTYVTETMFDFSKERVLAGFQRSLDLLGIDQIDLIQFHDIEFAEDINQVINETLPAVQSLVDAGKARYIGITGYPVGLLKHVIDKSSIKIDAVLSYARNTLIDDSLKQYIPYFKEKELGIICACAVCMGLLTMAGPRPWHPASQLIKDAVQNAREYCKENNLDLARIAMVYSLCTEGIHTFLMGANVTEIFRKNFDTVTTPPTDQELETANLIKSKFFDKLDQKHWEGIFPAEHWKLLKELKKSKN